MPTQHTISDGTSGLKLDPAGCYWQQIAAHLSKRMAVGLLRAGARLPSIRALARELGTDPGTVARAYRELERQGVITCRSGGGSFVSTVPARQDPAPGRRAQLDMTIERAIAESLAVGFDLGDVETAFAAHIKAWERFRSRESSTSAGHTSSAAPPARSIRFAGSHDLAIELLAVHLSTVHPGCALGTAFVGSLAGLMALVSGDADIAGAHLFHAETGEFNIPFVKQMLPNDTVMLVNLVHREQGLMTAPANPKAITKVEDLGRRGISLANRQRGSGTRIMLDGLLRRAGIAPESVAGYEREYTTHAAVASRVSDGDADVALGSRSAAELGGLHFIPLYKEPYDLVGLERSWRHGPLSQLLDVVASAPFVGLLRALPGYDVSQTGKKTVVTA